jgi:biotin carboxyl carrier protein
MRIRSSMILAGLAAAALVAAASWYGYRQWRAWQAIAAAEKDTKAAPIADGNMPARLSAQARKNMGIVAKPVKVTTYWSKIEVPAVVTDRPGVSDLGVSAPVTGVVTRIYSHPGETIEPGAPLVTLRLTSESLHEAQRELYQAAQEIEIAREEKERLTPLAEISAIRRSDMIKIDNQLQRLDASVKAYRQDLLARGLTDAQVDEVAQGRFVKEITVRAPSEKAQPPAEVALVSRSDEETPVSAPFRYEFEELAVALGQQVEAGEVLCHLGDHRSLLIEGRGFMDDMPLIQKAAKEGYLIEIEFDERKGVDWPPAPKQLQVHHIDNTVDTESRTFSFHLVLENQWQVYQQGDHTGFLWRFRPGDRLHLKIAVEKLDDVIVLPLGAVVREGPEAYVFRQNGELFDRRPVHILAEDRTSVVIANDGSLRPTTFVAQNAAASINRVLKAQLASGQPTNVHVHADGTVHAAH